MVLPTREELLNIVRKHSGSLGSVGNEVDMRFWQQMLDMFFVKSLEASKESSHDDLLFFVRLPSFRYENESPYFVRRWNSDLSKVIGDTSYEVDWQQSFYLNLIAHTTYIMTVAICSLSALRKRKEPDSPWSPLYEVTKRVYASPSRINVLTKSSKASETVPSYPDIYFTVDDFDDTFQNLILTDTDHCYCVFLHACGGAAFGGNTDPIAAASSQSAFVQGALFSGSVSYEIVRSDFESNRILGILPKTKQINMRGPGGRGHVDVICSRVTDDEDPPADRKLGIGGLVRKAATAAKQVYLAASSGTQSGESISLRCCLTSLSLPWKTLACDLLFKIPTSTG